MAAASSSQAAPLATAPAAMAEAAGSSDPKKGIYFTNNMRDRQARGKYTYVEESSFLWAMKQHQITSRLQQEQQRQQQRQQQLQSQQVSQQQLARQVRDQQKQMEHKYVKIQKLLHELQQMQQQIQHAQLHQPHDQLQQMQHKHKQMESKCHQMQLQYQGQVQVQKQLQEHQQFRKTGQSARQQHPFQQPIELPTVATTNSTDVVTEEDVPKAMLGGIFARQASGQADDMSDDDLPSVVGYGPYWDAVVEATVEFDPENFEQTDPRRHAAAVLDTPELLMMYAQSTGDSIPATRLKFMRMMCGYDEEVGEHLTGGRSNEPVRKRICMRKSKSKNQDANGKFAQRRRRQNYT